MIRRLSHSPASALHPPTVALVASGREVPYDYKVFRVEYRWP